MALGSSSAQLYGLRRDARSVGRSQRWNMDQLSRGGEVPLRRGAQGRATEQVTSVNRSEVGAAARLTSTLRPPAQAGFVAADQQGALLPLSRHDGSGDD